MHVQAGQELRATLGCACKNLTKIFVVPAATVVRLEETSKSSGRLLRCGSHLGPGSPRDELRSPCGLFADGLRVAACSCCLSVRAASSRAEMTQSLSVLQALSTDTAVMLTRLESACAK